MASTLYAPLALAQLLTALRVVLWREYGAGEVFPHVGTGDGEHYTCVVLDADGDVREDASPFTSPCARDAVAAMLHHYECADVEAALAEGEAHRTLADDVPTVYVGAAPLTREVNGDVLDHGTGVVTPRVQDDDVDVARVA